MKITTLRIRNLFGIKEFDSDGHDKELIGKNGVGKSAVLDAIKYALTNKSDREYLIRKGEEEGEVFIETDTGLKITRKARTNKADYKSIKQGNDKREKTEGFLREIFTELQLNPIEFSSMTDQEQNRIILDLIDFKWDLKWIEAQFGEIPAGVDFQQNILCVLHDIQSEKGQYFLNREEINRERRNKQAFIEEIGASLPAGYNAKKWEDADLGSVYTKIETIRNSNDRILAAQKNINEAMLKKQEAQITKNNERTRLNDLEKDDLDKIEAQISQLKTNIRLLEQRIPETQKTYTLLHENVEQKYKTDVAEVEGILKANCDLHHHTIADFSDLQGEANMIEAMKGYIKEYNRMIALQKEVVDLAKQSEDLTAKIEKARELPGIILETSNIPVEGLSIKDGLPLINGLPISNLSEGEKFELCISIATKNPNSLQMLLIDGIERLATDKRDKVYANLKKKGVQFIATRTTDDDDLRVIEL